MKAAFALTDRELWGQSVGWFYMVIAQIEQSLDRCKAKHSALPKILASFDALRRTAAFEKDLKFFLGEEWRERLTTPPAVSSYVAHI
eukprot:CAMPEP_0173384980 /NCGR_PEP_ID=MMETSP1356-20130122/7565_1 /TAXON_ID=77927 ORGANISM="Hemiselmis virescens, Strain PCC157" /NCGR_SAMPLE_ID=MMETSP1356 /ASSEMBLY_ACC=CAM_ASM_000847 /LENGTH=86 /DNA_ID=CAMNT_0014340583 /DNA_START=65 /DNA_END=322 /DNA_ORIENTATION=-